MSNVNGTPSSPTSCSRDFGHPMQEPSCSGATRRSRGAAPIELVRHVDYELAKARLELADIPERRWFARQLLSWRIASLVEWKEWLAGTMDEGTRRVNSNSETP